MEKVQDAWAHTHTDAAKDSGERRKPAALVSVGAATSRVTTGHSLPSLFEAHPITGTDAEVRLDVEEGHEDGGDGIYGF